MLPIIIDNEIKLVDEKFGEIEVEIRVPAKNIQNMLEETDGLLLEKNQVSVDFNHYAGQLYSCRVLAPTSKIKDKLKRQSLFDSVKGKDEFLSLVDSDILGHSVTNPLSNTINGLYAFGDCRDMSIHEYTTEYYYKNGRKIRLNDNNRTDNGTKRYVKNNGQWVSNRKF